MNTYTVKELLHYCNITVDFCSKIPVQLIDYYDLTFVLKGSMTYLANDTEYILKENDAILIPPGSKRERLAGTKPVSYVSFNFQAFDNSCVPSKIFMNKVISHEIRNLVSVFPQSHISQLYRSKEKVTNILNYILLELSNILDFKSSNSHVTEIIKYINESIKKPLSLAMVSRYLHLSKEYTAYIFKKETGKTVTEYINRRKMLLAKNMIQSGEMPLNCISDYLGYENYSYFSKLYKKHFGEPPKCFKNKY